MSSLWKWLRSNLSPSDPLLLEAQLKRAEAMNAQLTMIIEKVTHDECRYYHCEIEGACGGEIAQQVRNAVLARREKLVEDRLESVGE